MTALARQSIVGAIILAAACSSIRAALPITLNQVSHQVSAVAASCTIKTQNDLQSIEATGSYCLANDINATGVFTPIPRFSGTLDGKGHVIRNLVIDSAALEVGLFGRTDSRAQIMNLGLVRAKISSKGTNQFSSSAAGALVGANRGLISHVYVSGTIAGSGSTTSIGGLVGVNFGTISQSAAFIPVSLSGGVYGYVGGLVGANCGTISQSYAGGAVKARGYVKVVGGLVGGNCGLVEDSYATGAVSGVGSPADINRLEVGGLVGQNSNAIRGSFATGKVAGSSAETGQPQKHSVGFVGGLVGRNLKQGSYVGSITRSYASGTVVGLFFDNWSAAVGGLAGSTGNHLDHSYSTGLVVSNADSASNVTAGGLAAKGSVGSASYWDIDTSRQPSSLLSRGTGLRTAAFKSKLPSGFATTIWGISNTWSYPFLLATNTWLPPVRSRRHTSFPDQGAVSFRSTLSAGRTAARSFTFVPLGQLQAWQYHALKLETDSGIATASEACLATVYAMIFRLVGTAHPELTVTYSGEATTEPLSQVGIDYFLKSPSDATAKWPELFKEYALVNGMSVSSPPSSVTLPAFDFKEVAAKLKSGDSVVMHACEKGNSSSTEKCGVGHWILATSALKTASGTITGIVAIDPWLGRQVVIGEDGRVSDPPNYSTLAYFSLRANGYYAVSFE